ncbi:MAG: PH domain-containing protein [Clostridiales bacterium]|nr:PH domain-containing protein [Clostridiales bacterium]MCD8352711.1 PH domain-containing protein [Clostridiales bacterium]
MIDFNNGSFVKLRKDSTVRERGVAALLIPGEEVLGSYTAMRDYIVFTNKRVISVNVQGITGKKKDYTSMPYSKVSVFSVETSGTLDLDSELELYFSGVGKVTFEFTGASDIVAIGQAISMYVLK